MTVSVTWLDGHRLEGTNDDGIVTAFDSHPEHGKPFGASPMSVMLQSLPACSAMDVLDIIRKKRKTVSAFRIGVQADRADEHPRIYSSVHLQYMLTSDDATLNDLNRAIELSQEKYCSVSAMFRLSGCAITWTAELRRNDGTVVKA